MPKFLWKASYTADGVKGLVEEGGTGRRGAIEKMLQSAGGKLETFYYALGEHDAYAVVDLPDASSATAVSMAIASGAGARVITVPLLTCEQVDDATKKAVSYRAPGK